MDDGKKASLPFIKQVFSVGIQAPRGGRQSFQKIINFIIWLRNQHFNVGTISFDQYQSSFAIETLEQQGFQTKKLSVDMDEYIALKNLLIDQRIELIKNQLQEDELVKTQRINNKISHPEDEEGGHGDLGDALSGSVYTLISEQISARPPAKNLAAITSAVNRGIRQSNIQPSINISNSKSVTRFPRLR